MAGSYEGTNVSPVAATVAFEDTEAGRRIAALEERVKTLSELLAKQLEKEVREQVAALRG